MKRKTTGSKQTKIARTPRKTAATGRRAADKKQVVSRSPKLFQISPALSKAIQTASDAIKRNDGMGIIAILEPLAKQLSQETSAAREAYTALLAYGNAIAGRLPEAEKISENGLQEWSDSLDLRYVHAYVKLALREHAQAIDAALTFRRAYELYPDTKRPRLDFSATPGHLSQVCNVLGSAYLELGKKYEAEQAFRDAIIADPGNHLPFLNLARLLTHLGRTVEVTSLLEEGMSTARQVQEIRMMMNSQQKKATISACMMVKNEEQLLGGCLESIRDWVDEIIIVDTGSTDKTVEIAKSYGAKIFHQPWEGNFSKHRNYSVEQATCDWILIIDADERVEQDDLSRLHQALKQTEFRVLSLSVFNVYGERNESATFLPSIRLFRRELNLRYQGIVHNMLYVPDEIPVARVGVRVRHLGYNLSPEKMAKKMERTKTLLEKQLTDNPKNAFAHFNYAQLLRGSKEGDKAEHIATVLHSASQAVALTDPKKPRERHIHLMALNQLAWTYFFTKDFQQARANCERALALKPGYLDPLMLLGHVFIRIGDLEKADYYYRQYLTEQARYQPHLETDNIILHHPDSRPSALYGLAMIAITRGDDLAAQTAFEQTIAVHDHYLDTNIRLGRLYLQSGELEKAKDCFALQIKYNPEDKQALLGLGMFALHDRNWKEAQKRFEAVLAADPYNLSAQLHLGHIHLQQGNRKAAVHHFAEAVQHHDAELVVETVITEIRTDVENYTGAITLFEALVNEGIQSARLYTELGNCCFKLNTFKQAEQWFTKALQLDASSDIVLYNLGLTQARLGKYESALTMLTRYFVASPEALDIAHVIGDIHSKMKQYVEAVSFYEKVLTTQPYDTAVLIKLSDCYLYMGHADSARLGYQRVLQIEPQNKTALERLEKVVVGTNSRSAV